MSESQLIYVSLALLICALLFIFVVISPLLIVLLAWPVNNEYRRVLALVPSFAERYDMRIMRDQGDWYARWPRAVGNCGQRAIFLETINGRWYQPRRGLRLGMAVNAKAEVTLQAHFPAGLYDRWQENQEAAWSPLDQIDYSSRPAELGDWLFVENELLDLKLEEHLGRFYQQQADNREFTLYGAPGRLWIDFPDTHPNVDQLVIATQILEKFAAALESNHDIG